MEQVKSGRWISSSHILPGREEASSSVLLDIGEMTTMNETDDLLFAHEIYLFNIVDKSMITMSDRAKLTISPALYSQYGASYINSGNLVTVLTELLGANEFVVTTNKIRNINGC